MGAEIFLLRLWIAFGKIIGQFVETNLGQPKENFLTTPVVHTFLNSKKIPHPLKGVRHTGLWPVLPYGTAFGCASPYSPFRGSSKESFTCGAVLLAVGSTAFGCLRHCLWLRVFHRILSYTVKKDK